MWATLIGAGISLFGANKARKASAAADRAQAAAAEQRRVRAEGLGQAELDFSQEEYGRNRAVGDQVSDFQFDVGRRSAAQGDELYSYGQGIGRDAEGYDTAQRREDMANRARAGVQQQGDAAMERQQRGLSRMGVNPSSGRSLSMGNQSALAMASGMAGADRGARQTVEDTGWGRRMDAAGLRVNLAGATRGAYGTAVDAGSAGLTNRAAAGVQRLRGMGQGTGTIMGGYGQPPRAQSDGGASAYANIGGGLMGAGLEKWIGRPRAVTPARI